MAIQNVIPLRTYSMQNGMNGLALKNLALNFHVIPPCHALIRTVCPQYYIQYPISWNCILRGLTMYLDLFTVV